VAAGAGEEAGVLLCAGLGCTVALERVRLSHAALVAEAGAHAALRSCAIAGAPAGAFVSSAALSMADCVVSGCTQSLIGEAAAHVTLVDTTLARSAGDACEVRGRSVLSARNCTFITDAAKDGWINDSVWVHGASAAELVECALSHGVTGLRVEHDGSRATLVRCAVDHNGSTGVSVQAGAEATLTECSLSHTKASQGLHVRDPGTAARIVRCRLIGNSDAGAWAYAGARVHLESSQLCESEGSQVRGAAEQTAPR
jgi:Right handed beta helix region